MGLQKRILFLDSINPKIVLIAEGFVETRKQKGWRALNRFEAIVLRGVSPEDILYIAKTDWPENGVWMRWVTTNHEVKYEKLDRRTAAQRKDYELIDNPAWIEVLESIANRIVDN